MNPMQVPALPSARSRCRATKTNGKQCQGWAALGGMCQYHSSPQQHGQRHQRSPGDVPYATYLQSEHWIRRRATALQDAGYRCRCGRTDDLEVHHRSYEHLWNEPDEDLEVLCDRCHEVERIAPTASFESRFPKHAPETDRAERKRLTDLPPAEAMARVLNAGRGWACEESLHSILGAWEEAMGPAYIPRSKRLLKNHFAGARIIRDEVGEEHGAKFIAYAAGEMKQARLTIADIWSTHWLFAQFREQGAEHDDWYRRRYLRGTLADHGDEEC